MRMVAEALNWNNEVWAAFMDDCRSSDNRLPEKLRGGILSLAIWVGKETKLAMNGDSDLDMLIAVNRDIMKGLSSSGSSDAPNRSIPGGNQEPVTRPNTGNIKT